MPLDVYKFKSEYLIVERLVKKKNNNNNIINVVECRMLSFSQAVN